ncbi:MAG: ribosome biogenesis factor YjgA [Thermodesulfobacteriota bacterium]
MNQPMPAIKSRTKNKQDDRNLQKIGEELLNLPRQILESFDFPDELKESIQFFHTIRSHGARRRQLQYIGVLMREMELETIQGLLKQARRRNADKNQAFHKIEEWRDELKSGNLSCIPDILADCPLADPKQLESLARNSMLESKVGRGNKSSRALFRYLRECLPKTDISIKTGKESGP